MPVCKFCIILGKTVLLTFADTLKRFLIDQNLEPELLATVLEFLEVKEYVIRQAQYAGDVRR